MANIASLLKGEISRLSNKAARQHVGPVQSSTAALRKQVSALKKQMQTLEREINALKRNVTRDKPDTAPVEAERKNRFTTKGLLSLRGRLGLNAADMGRLVGVSQQTIYSWEKGKTKPRRNQVAAIAAARRMGKREVRTRLGYDITS